jgi:phage FluMu protein Com
MGFEDRVNRQFRVDSCAKLFVLVTTVWLLIRCPHFSKVGVGVKPGKPHITSLKW